MYSYTKLFNSIVTSTVWVEPNPVRIVWLTMLALADRNGCVAGSIPGLASVARVSVKECEDAISKFLGPDTYSRTKEYEGRRIAEIDGGWLLLNHAKFRAIRDEEARREQTREATRRYRSKKEVSEHAHVSQGEPPSSHAEAAPDAAPDAAPAPEITLPNGRESVDEPSADPDPTVLIRACWHEECPHLPQPRVFDDDRKRHLKAFWKSPVIKSDLQCVRELFQLVAHSDFLSGRSSDWKADLYWVIKPSSVAKIVDGNYDNANLNEHTRV